MSAQSSSPSPRRRPRGRLLVVGTSPEVREFASLTRKHIDAVSESPNLFEAIAEIGIAGDREPIVAVAFVAGCDGYSSTDALRAIESADKSLAIVLLYPRGDEQSAAAIAEGFEDTIPIPATAEDVIEVFASMGLTDFPRGKTVDASGVDIETFRRNDSARVVDSMIARARANAHAHPESPIEDAPKATDRTSMSPQLERAQEREQAQLHEKERETPPPISALPREPSAAKPAMHPVNHAAERPAAHSAARPSAPVSAPASVPVSAPAAIPASLAPSFTAAGESEPKFDAAQIEEIIALRDRALLRALQSRKPVRDVALVLIRHLLKTQDIRLASPPRLGEEGAIARDRAGVFEAPVLGAQAFHGVLLSRTIDAERLALWSVWLAEWLDLEATHAELHRLATVDELTGALNRRALATMLPAILERARAERRLVSLMYFDIDDFKIYNDRYGHPAGDEVLRESIAALRDSIRAGDLVFRMGGDEFVVVFCDPNPPRRGGSGVPENVEDIAERCRDAVRRLQLPALADSGPGPVTISAGCAVFPWDRDAIDAEGLLTLADKRALEAKRLGKDQICFGPNRRSPGSSG